MWATALANRRTCRSGGAWMRGELWRSAPEIKQLGVWMLSANEEDGQA